MKAKLVLIVALMMFLLTGCGGSGSDAADTYTPAALDADATYYADIDIADYGVITVQLDHSSL